MLEVWEDGHATGSSVEHPGCDPAKGQLLLSREVVVPVVRIGGG